MRAAKRRHPATGIIPQEEFTTATICKLARSTKLNENGMEGNEIFIAHALAVAGAQFGSNSPNQSPPNESVAKGVSDPMSLGSLPSSIPNSVGLQSIANNDSSIRGMNSNAAAVSTGDIIMTNSSMGSTAGGSLVSSSANKQNLNNTTTSMITTSQPHLAADPSVPQGMQNEQMAAMVIAMQHMHTRAPVPHSVHTMGPRMQPPNMLQMGSVGQGMADNSSYACPTPNHGGPQGTEVGVVALQQPPTNIGIQQTQTRFNGPVDPTSGGEDGMDQTQPPAPSSAQPQSGAPTGTQSGPQTAIQNQAGTGAPAALTSAEKLKLIQQQLILLHHAYKCQRRESQANGGVWQCTLPHCKTMKNVLNHMRGCQPDKNCCVPHCTASFKILTHWKECVLNDCPICLPLKPRNKTTPVNPPQTMQSPNPSASDRSIATTSTGLLPNTQPGAGGPTIPNLSANMGGVRIFAPPQGQLAPNVRLQLPSSLQAGQVTGTPKEWHQSITPGLRNHLVHKLVLAIFPNPDPQAMLDKRMQNIRAYARKVEGNMYEIANSRSEYCHLIADKIYKIQMALEEKKQKRIELKLQQQQPLLSRNIASVNPPQTTQLPNSSAWDIKRAYDALGIQYPTTGAAPLLTGLLPNAQSRPGLPLPGAGGFTIPNMGGVRLLARGQAVPNISLPLGSDPTPTPNTAAPVAANIEQSISSIQQLFGVGPGDARRQSVLPSGLQPGQITAKPVQGTKEWQQSVAPGLRNYLVQKLVLSIFPTATSQAMLDKRMQNLVAYVRIVEGDLYQIANSRSQYYHLLAEKLCKMQNVKEEVRQKHKEEQLQQKQQQPAELQPGLAGIVPVPRLPTRQQLSLRSKL